MSLKSILGLEENHKGIQKYNDYLNEQERIKNKRFKAQLLVRVYNLIIDGYYKNYLETNNFLFLLNQYKKNDEYIENEKVLNETVKFIFLNWTKDLYTEFGYWNLNALPKVKDFENLIKLEPLKKSIGEDWFKTKNDYKTNPKFLVNYKNTYSLFKELRPDLQDSNKNNNTLLEKQLEKNLRYIDQLVDWNKNLQEQNQELVNENKELKQKLKKYEQTQ